MINNRSTESIDPQESDYISIYVLIYKYKYGMTAMKSNINKQQIQIK